MDLTHRFTVPTSVEETWAHFNDVAAVAECFPGASITTVEGETFRGSVKVKLGPIALLYTGSGTFVEKDEAAHRFRVEAKGKDKRGNGTAGAKVTLTMTDAGGATEVEVVTDLAITGKPAQFGRGVMQDVSDKLLGQFVSCLEERLSGGPAPDVPVGDQAADLGGSGGPGGPGGPSASGDPGTPAPALADLPVVPPAGPTPAPTGAPPDPARARQAAGPAHRAPDDALDLGATVVPVLLRTYAKPLGAVLAGLLALRWILGRRRS